MSSKTVSRFAMGAGLALAITFLCTGASAQMYSWKDAKGVTHFSDQPPPDASPGKAAPKASVRKAGDTRLASNQPTLPYALAEAVKRNPVVLYTTAACAGCDQGRALLQQRGVPYTEKTVSSHEDQQQLKATGSDGRLPLLLVGGRRQSGFEAGAWQEMLSAATYPPQSQLPPSWRQASPEAAAPPKPAQAPEPQPEQARPEPVRPTPPPPSPVNAPPGFKF